MVMTASFSITVCLPSFSFSLFFLSLSCCLHFLLFSKLYSLIVCQLYLFPFLSLSLTLPFSACTSCIIDEISRRSIDPIEPRVFHRIHARSHVSRSWIAGEIGSPPGSAPMAYPSVPHGRRDPLAGRHIERDHRSPPSDSFVHVTRDIPHQTYTRTLPRTRPHPHESPPSDLRLTGHTISLVHVPNDNTLNSKPWAINVPGVRASLEHRAIRNVDQR